MCEVKLAQQQDTSRLFGVGELNREEGKMRKQREKQQKKQKNKLK